MSCQTSSMDFLLGVPGDEGDEHEDDDFESELEIPFLLFLAGDGHMVMVLKKEKVEH